MVQDENLDELIELIEKLLDFDPTDDRALRQLSALKEARKDHHPSHGQTSSTLAKLYEAQGHHQEALEVYEGLIRENPKEEYVSAAKELRAEKKFQGSEEDVVSVLQRMLISIEQRRRVR